MKPFLAVTMGDYNGIGPEVVLKSIHSPTVQRICSLILVGSTDVYKWYAKKFGLRLNFHEIGRPPARRAADTFPVLNLRTVRVSSIRPGKISREAGAYAWEALEAAAVLSLSKVVDGIITAPVSKEAMVSAGYKYPGQTELLSHLSGARRAVMMLIAGSFRVALATVHTPLRNVARGLSPKAVLETLSVLSQSLTKDFGIRSPRIAVLGLNPHAGENGKIGTEEGHVILPAIRQARRAGVRAEGPYSADGFFGSRSYENFDAVLAMYHDQGLIPLKMKGFFRGVNYSAGLPIIRTSPDHGTAFAISGKGIADPQSMIEAIRLAVSIINRRRQHA